MNFNVKMTTKTKTAFEVLGVGGLALVGDSGGARKKT